MQQKQHHATTPIVSVLIPVYNGTEFLDEAIQSVLKSTYKSLEIILVDDGSSDLSRQKCLEYAQKYDHVSFYGFKKNRGMTRCLNFGVRKAKGKYIARINQDDIMLPNRLKQQVSFLEKHPDYVVLGGAIQLFTATDPRFDILRFPLTDQLIRQQWMNLSPYSDPSVMYRKSAWLKTEGYSQFFWPADDVHMWYQLGSLGKMANLPQILTKVRWHEDCGSLKSHRRQMVKTYEVHLWASEFITKPSFSTRIFWLCQLMAGLVLPPNFNWWVYRWIRKAQRLDFLRFKPLQTKTPAAVPSVIPQPTKANLSGA